jgi:hypothetical protein
MFVALTPQEVVYEKRDEGQGTRDERKAKAIKLDESV